MNTSDHTISLTPIPPHLRTRAQIFVNLPRLGREKCYICWDFYCLVDLTGLPYGHTETETVKGSPRKFLTASSFFRDIHVKKEDDI